MHVLKIREYLLDENPLLSSTTIAFFKRNSSSEMLVLLPSKAFPPVTSKVCTQYFDISIILRCLTSSLDHRRNIG